MTQASNIYDVYHPTPLVVVISGPSGVGKDSVIQAMRKRLLSFHFVVTATSRPPREGEVHGVDYFFHSKEEFEAMIAHNQLIEHAHVYDDYKGIPRPQVEQAIASGKDVIFRVDVQGARRLRQIFPQAVMIFIVPTNEEEIYQRLYDRGTETAATLQTRLLKARDEMLALPIFDYLVVNANNRLEYAVDDIIAIIDAEHHNVNHRKVEL